MPGLDGMSMRLLESIMMGPANTLPEGATVRPTEPAARQLALSAAAVAAGAAGSAQAAAAAGVVPAAADGQRQQLPAAVSQAAWQAEPSACTTDDDGEPATAMALGERNLLGAGCCHLPQCTDAEYLNPRPFVGGMHETKPAGH